MAGDGYPAGTANSDPLYNITLMFADGAQLTGQYTPTTNTFLSGSSATVGDTTYTLTEFSFIRNLGDTVSQFVAVQGGDPNDYSGNVRFTTSTTAVPEPASWAMMIGCFAPVGGVARRRRSTIRITYA